MQITWTTVFADGPDGGNPCPIVSDADDLSTEQMQAMTVEFGVETVFVLTPIAGGDVRLRYFVPRHEMEMCVHATIAATVQLGDRLPRPARVETALGIIDVTRDGDAAVVDQFPPVYGPIVEPGAVLDALRLPADSLIGPTRSVSTARAKLMIPLRDEATLDTVQPDFERLWNVCDDLDVTGFYPFARRGNRSRRAPVPPTLRLRRGPGDRRGRVRPGRLSRAGRARRLAPLDDCAGPGDGPAVVDHRRGPGRRRPGHRDPRRWCHAPDQPTSGLTCSATKRTKPTGSGSSAVGCSTTASTPAAAQRPTASATVWALPATATSLVRS